MWEFGHPSPSLGVRYGSGSVAYEGKHRRGKRVRGQVGLDVIGVGEKRWEFLNKRRWMRTDENGMWSAEPFNLYSQVE